MARAPSRGGGKLRGEKGTFQVNELGPWNLEGGVEALFALQKLMNGAGFFFGFHELPREQPRNHSHIYLAFAIKMTHNLFFSLA